MSVNISAKSITLTIGSQNWSAWIESIQIGYGEYAMGSGLMPCTGTINLIFPATYAGIPSNPEYRFNPSQWQRGQSVTIQSGGAFLPCSGQQLFILVPPQRPSRVINGIAQLSIQIGCKLALEYFPPEPNDDLAKVTPNTPKDRGAIINEVLTTLGISGASASVPVYPIAYPLPKLEGNWLEFCGKIADSAGYYLRCNTAGTIVAELILGGAIVATYTIGTDESDWQPIGDVAEQSIEKLIVTGINYKVSVKSNTSTVTTRAAIAEIDPDTPFEDGNTRLILRDSSILTTEIAVNRGDFPIGGNGVTSGRIYSITEAITEQLPVIKRDPDTPFEDGNTRLNLGDGRVEITRYFLDATNNVYKTEFTKKLPIALIDPDTPFEDGNTRLNLRDAEITTTEWARTGDRQWTKATSKRVPIVISDPDTPFEDGNTRLNLTGGGGTGVDTNDTSGPPQNIGSNTFDLQEEQLKSEIYSSLPASAITRERQRTISVPFAVSQAQLTAYGQIFNKLLNGRAFGWRFATRLNTTLLPFQQVRVHDGTQGYLLYTDAMQWAISQTEAILIFNGIEAGVYNVATPDDVTFPVSFPIGLMIATLEATWTSSIFAFDFEATILESTWTTSALYFDFADIALTNNWTSSITP